MKTKLTLFVTVLAAALFLGGCSSFQTTETKMKKGLVLYYPFDGSVRDASGHEYDKDVKRFSWKGGKRPSLSVDRNGQANKAYKFNGDSWISIGNQVPYESNITVSAWIRTEHKSEWVYIVSGKAKNFIFALNEGKLAFGGENKDPFNHDTISSSLLNDGQWRHAVASYNGSTVKVYVDGVLENTSTKSGMFENTGLNIGNAKIKERPSWNMKGSIDDVRIYKRALSAEEVKALYDLEKPKGK